MLQKIHSYHSSRRIKILSTYVSNLIPSKSKVLDVGCGDGVLDRKIHAKKHSIKITGTDIFKRKKTLIPVVVFDGKKLPFPNNSFDCVLLIDTLHHTRNLSDLLKEAVRVSRKNIIIKDHYFYSQISFNILKLLDWLGNRPYGVALTYNYYNRKQWESLYKKLNLEKEEEINNLNLFSFPSNLIFDRNYHFIVKLKIK